MNAIASIANNGDGTYDFAFADPVTLGSGGDESSLFLFSPSADNWANCGVDSQIDANTLRVTEDNENTDCTEGFIYGQPTTFSSASPFTAVPPVTTIP
jgi:hypothetical protein